MVTYLAGCGLQSCPILLAKGYPDIGWNPIEGERYLSFLRFAVFVNGKTAVTIQSLSFPLFFVYSFIVSLSKHAEKDSKGLTKFELHSAA